MQFAAVNPRSEHAETEIGLFADPSTIASRLDSVSGILPSGAVEVIRDQLTRLTSQGNRTLGISFVIGLVVALWSANSG